VHDENPEPISHDALSDTVIQTRVHGIRSNHRILSTWASL